MFPKGEHSQENFTHVNTNFFVQIYTEPLKLIYNGTNLSSLKIHNQLLLTRLLTKLLHLKHNKSSMLSELVIYGSLLCRLFTF